MQKKFSFKNNRLAKTIVYSGSVLIIVAFIIIRYEGFLSILSHIMNILRPIIIGGVIAFALNRPLNFVHILYRKLFNSIKGAIYRKSSKKNSLSHEYKGKTPFVAACITTYIIAFAVIIGIICFIVPQISESIKLFIDNVEGYYNNFKNMLDRFKFIIDPEFLDKINIDKVVEKITELSDYIPTVLEKTYGITASIINVLIDLIVGIVFSVYILIDKQNLKKHAKMLSKSILREKKYEKFSKITELSYNTFANFISGQLTEAVILGVLCFIGMSIFKFDYAPLISVIIGITNMIPIAGPILGTIPCALILLLVNPIDAVWFVVFIIVIQQIDSNLIYPKVVGNSIGLPALWVLFAITVGGGLGGVLGMILGVPMVSILYAIISEKLSSEEKKQINAE